MTVWLDTRRITTAYHIAIFRKLSVDAQFQFITV